MKSIIRIFKNAIDKTKLHELMDMVYVDDTSSYTVINGAYCICFDKTQGIDVDDIAVDCDTYIEIKQGELTAYRASGSNIPLYYYESDNEFIISSRIELILNEININLDLDKSYMTQFLITGINQSELTPFDKVKRLCSSFKLIYNGNILLERAFNNKKQNCHSSDTQKNYFLTKLKSSIRMMINQCKVIGCEVSGGVDSSYIAFYLNEIVPPHIKLIGFLSYLMARQILRQLIKSIVTQE